MKLCGVLPISRDSPAGVERGAVIGVYDQLNGQLPMGFLCLNKSCDRPHAEIIAECVSGEQLRLQTH
ncbi:MAG TPA: hypothetical protein VKA18_01535 [Alphaproteobacteria bacterium]|nr:hypothetical protein [Alphaproteobacteria bacterium]